MKRIPSLQDKDWLEVEYASKSALRIAHDSGCSEGSVRNALRRYGIPLRPYKPAVVPLRDQAWLTAMVTTHTVEAIATQIGCKPTVVYTALRRHHIVLPPPSKTLLGIPSFRAGGKGGWPVCWPIPHAGTASRNPLHRVQINYYTCANTTA